MNTLLQMWLLSFTTIERLFPCLVLTLSLG